MSQFYVHIILLSQDIVFSYYPFFASLLPPLLVTLNN
nr:MAG TPA: hypothetical protein [Caudoviricetes sp.]